MVSMKLYHVEGKELKPMDVSDQVTFLDGDVYVVDTDDKIWIWIGKDAGVEEGTVAAWISNKMDKERDGLPDVMTITQGEEPEEFKAALSFTVVDGDTPGFLVPAKLDMVEFKMYRVHSAAETPNWDDAEVMEVPLDRKSLKSNDVFVIDGNEVIYCWIGKGASREERFEGQKLLQKIDADRQYLPIQVTITEGEGTKAEKAFYKFLDEIKGKGPELSVEDKREATYKPDKYKTAEEFKKETEKEEKTKSGKRGFLSRLFGRG